MFYKLAQPPGAAEIKSVDELMLLHRRVQKQPNIHQEELKFLKMELDEVEPLVEQSGM